MATTVVSFSPDSPVLTIPEVSAYLKIPASTVRLYIRRGVFSFKRVGKRFLIPKLEVEKFATTGFVRQGEVPQKRAA